MRRRALSMLRRSPLLATVIGVAVLASAGFAVASALPGTGSTIHACLQKNSGALRVVGSAKDCKKSERAISFAKEGPRGLTGQTGAQGPAGANGKDGAQGPQGPQGPAGQDAPKAAPPHQAVIGTATLTGATTGPMTFDVLGYAVAADGPPPCTSGGICSGTGSLGDLQLVKRLDASSPVLMQLAAGGRHFSGLTLDLQQPGQSAYRHYAFTNPLVSDIEQSAPDAGGKPVETVTLAVQGVTQTLPRGGVAPARMDTPVGQITIGDAGIDKAPVYSSDFDLTMPITTSTGTGAGTGKAELSDLAIGKALDSKSAAMMSAVLGNTRWTTAKLELFAPGTTDVAHTYDLTNVVPSSLRDRNTGESGDTASTEDVTLSYQTIKETNGTGTGCWDLKNNVACPAG